MRRVSAITFFVSLGIAASAHAADTAIFSDDESFSPTVSEAEPNVYVGIEGGGVYFDLPGISANAVAATDAGTFGLSPDLDHWGYTAGGEVGVRLGEVGGNPVWLKGSGFFSQADADDSVLFEPNLGAFAWQGLWGGNNWAYGETPSLLGNRARIGFQTEGPNFHGSGVGVSSGDEYISMLAFSDLGAAYISSGNSVVAPGSPSTNGISASSSRTIDYNSSVKYWGGELAVASETVVSPNRVIVSPFAGGLYRGFQRDLTTTLNNSYFSKRGDDNPQSIESSHALSESLEGQYFGPVLGFDVKRTLGNGVSLDLSFSGAPLYLDADYRGYETNSHTQISSNSIFDTSGSATSPELIDSENRFAGLLRAGAAVGVPLFGNFVLELTGQVEYLTHSPTISRTNTASASVSGKEASAEAGECCDPDGQVPLASLSFDDMFAYSVAAKIVLPIGN